MRNYVHPGDTLDLTAPAGGIASGEGFLFGDIFGVAAMNAAPGALVAVKVAGVFRLPKVAASGLTEGQKVYWSAAERKVTGTASGNTLIGHCTKAAAAGTADVLVRVSN
ncbi:DUF2190 family protein [Microvirga tunisiensis]|uniref:DUF2190 family protein n=1 Tax=Pannonibacter tanglangensis TaxID=2750084 RepID=A0A7X5F3U6_9HYPH|nr:DUF2190 family protein [Pannonibacter sp. XCT-53]NBN79283.1 DUF2190 family protein [Pannonibacter sp. XCT-53]